MTGGIGRKALTSFYRDHFIFSNPEDTQLELISRTVGTDRVIDEFIFCFTHDKMIDWLYVCFSIILLDTSTTAKVSQRSWNPSNA